MSYTSRTRLYEIGREKLCLEMEEWEFIVQHIGDFCALSDQKVKEKFGIEANEDVCVGKEEMTDEQFVDFVKPLVQEILERYGYRKKKGKAMIIESESDPNYENWLANEGQKMQHKMAEEQTQQENKKERN
jgi:hypothetical protein